MNTSVEGIIVNNCQYAPIYLIQDPGASQANTYVLTSSTLEQSKPVSNNLKTFYENSGNIENGFINTDAGARHNAIKKKEGVLIRNNLKLASFLLPKNDSINKQYVLDNIILKPNITTTTTTTITTTCNPVPVNHHPVNTVPKIDIDRKIVKLKEVPIIRHRPEKVLPKIKPKENTPSPTQSKHTSVQLIKLGETYHSLNHLSDEQIKMVNQALKMFNDPDKSAPEPTYDPVTNTKYIYKVVSPKDLTVVAKKKIFIKDKKNHTKIPKRVEEKVVKQIMPKEVPIPKEVIEEEVEPPAEAKVTRSGRKVKLPKQILTEDSPQKTKKKSGTIVTCFQCSADFASLYRLQKHYENHPTHIPAKVHSNLFHCLLAIIKSGSEGDKTNIFIQQLEQLIVKLKSLLPCLLKKVDGTEGQSCTINDDISRLFGMNAGKYKIDVDALNCVKDKNGFCIHNPPKICQFNKDQNKPTQNVLKHVDGANLENETENCARINSVAKWPTVSKRIWKLKQKTHEQSAKKMRLKSEGDTLIELGTEDFMFPKEEENNVKNTAGIIPENNMHTADIIPEDNVSKLQEDTQECNCQPVTNLQTDNIVLSEHSKPKNNYVQFHSAHFDIRSSPIKSSSTFFRKFQICPSKMSNFDVPVIRSLEMNNKDRDKYVPMPTNTTNNLHVSMPNPDSNLHLPNTENIIHVSMPNSDNRHVTIPNSNNSLHVTIPNSDSRQHIPSSNNGIHYSMPNSHKSLHVNMPNDNNDVHDKKPNSSHALHGGLQNSDNRLHVNMPNIDNRLQVTMPNMDNRLHGSISNSNNSLRVNSDDRLHVSTPNSNNGLHVAMLDSDNSLHVSMPNSNNGLRVDMPNSPNSLHLTIPILNDSLHLSNSNDSLHLPNCNNGLHVDMPNSPNNLHLSIPILNDSLHLSNSNDSLHLPSSNDSLHLPNSNDSLQLPNSNDSLHVTISNSNSLHDLFKNDVDLSCKSSDVIDPDLKDWIISTSEKSEDGFTKSNSLIGPALLHVRDGDDKSLDSHKNMNHCDDMPSLDSSDNRLLSSQGESVLNFLDTLGNDLYPETEIRNNGVDFQMDLFTFS